MPALRLARVERVRRDAQVLLDGEPGQQPPALGHDRDAGAADVLGPPAREVGVAEQDRAADSTRSTPPTASTSVDLPAPFGPSSVVISPGGIASETSCSTAAAAARDARSSNRSSGLGRFRGAHRRLPHCSTSSVPR